MSKRDVQLVIRARSEADRAIDSISSALRTLSGVQDDVSSSGERTSNTLEKLSGAFKAVDAAVAKIDQSVGTASASFSAQQRSLAENEARYASLTREIASAEQAIVNTRIAMQSDGSAELVGRLAGAQQSYRGLVSEAGRLNTTISAQRGDVEAAGNALRGLESTAIAAKLSIGDLGDAGKREALESAVASRDAEAALRERVAAIREVARAQQEAVRDQIAAAKQEVAARNAQSSINSQLGVRDIGSGDARRSAEVFEEQARSQRAAAQASDELAAAADRLRARARPAAVEQDRINKEMAEAKTLYQAGVISIRDYIAELQRLETQMQRVQSAQGGANGNRNAPNEIKNKLGLRPYETQNLLYQVNDVITQLGSGAPLGQVFAQQGGQILQLFPQVLDVILKYWRGLTLVGVALAPVIIGMGRLNEVAAMQRDFAANLALSADKARYSTDALVENVDALDQYGASLEDATAAVKTFLSEAVNPELLDEMGRSAQNLSDITGKELTDSAEAVAKAFTGGYEAIADFDDKMNFLTLSEREQIRAMFDSGEASDARALAFQRFYEKAEQGAEETRTSWDRMTRQMTLAWADFRDWISDTSFLQNLRREIDEVAIGATYLLGRIRGLTHEAAGLNAVGRNAVGSNSVVNQGMNLAMRAVGGSASADPYDANSARAQKLESDRLYDEAKKKKPKKGRSGGKSDAEYQADLNREIERANKEREIQAEQTQRTNVLTGQALILEQRRQAIADAVRAVENKATKDGKRKLDVSAAQRAEIERTVGLEFDAKNAKALAQAEQQAHEKKINDLMGRRRELLAAIEFASPGSDTYKNLQTAVLGVNVQIEQATKDSIAFWQAIAGDPTKLATLGKTREEVDNIVAALNNQALSNRRDVLDAASKRAQAGLDDLRAMQGLLQEQIEFAQLQGEGGRAGQLAEQLVIVNDRLTQGAGRAIEFWRNLRGNPDDLALMGLTPEAVDNIILGLENTISASERLRTQFLKTGAALNQDLANGGATALESWAQALANGENALSSLGKAFLGFAADFLLQIGRMIAQQAIFNAISGGTAGGAGGGGGFLSGLLGGLFHGGGVVASGGRGRTVASAVFANAARYHRGGIAGLKPDEVPAILQRGEEVLTQADGRHRRNSGKGGGRGLSQVLAIGEEQIAKALAGAAGREMVLTHIRTERATINQELGNN
ncbi:MULTISPECIES: phage tail length tape measure family protein [unclassified Sphingopyxis]|uniref:phage tail length tape measure family protein n=1 Tax=unclassified Sphingopyxis TaxID=2614943 RepID=UPI00285E4175|nr:MULTISPECIES: phage tail length tape measure family protein [unclassified Sphingopyxis]MDR7062013.1 hypothetical protein [Sphingopyxis sp. BE235]MDR7182471.1 hypothetical protein [Sphingopyxis sp. BE249]